MTDCARPAPRRFIPALERFYEAVQPLSWLLIRLTAGLIAPLAILIIALETIGGICIAFGVMLAIVLRGGGPRSLDRELGREL